MSAIEAWFAAHPVMSTALVAVVGWVVSGVVNYLFAKRTSEEWDAFKAAHPRLAALVGISRALGLDAGKASRNAQELVAKRVGVKLPPPMPLLALAMVVALCVSGCRGVKSPQDATVDVIHQIAEAVRAADGTCAAIVRSEAVSDAAARDIGGKCVKAWRVATNALEAAEYAAKAWRTGVERELACAGVEALEGLASLVVAVREAGASIPAEVDRGLDGARLLARLGQAVRCGH